MHHFNEGKKCCGGKLEKVYIAGAFGNYINPENAKVLGLIPDVPTQKIKFVGNTALSGAKMTLVSMESREKAELIAKRVRYIELMTVPEFKREFFNSLEMPHRNFNRYPSVCARYPNISRLQEIY